MTNKPLVIRDEVHGDMVFDPVVRQVIDHDCFQRLRYIKQLGLAEYVFPCATHTRFQHSLGASYLAGQYFESLVNGWLSAPFGDKTSSGTTRFETDLSMKCVSAAANDEKSHLFWKRAIGLAGMLHDVGHGPWSHTFEFLELQQDFSSQLKKLTGGVAAHFQAVLTKQKNLKHEDISVLYIHQILSDLEEKGRVEGAMRFFLPVAALVNHKMTAGPMGETIEGELEADLKKAGIQGGVDLHRLLRPLISGPFDVDRMDYIQRDGRNCGVAIGGIEWRRIVTKVVPCLADYQNKWNEPRDVVLISNIKNQHVLDDFIFSLFQMYAQVYMHPKIVGVEETAKRLLRKSKREKLVVTFAMHRSLSDERFRSLLKSELGVPQIEDMLIRKVGSTFHVATSAQDGTLDTEMKEGGYQLVDTQDRPMMKDSMGVFLYSSVKGTNSPDGFYLKPWSDISEIAKQFYKIKYSPKIWLKGDGALFA